MKKLFTILTTILFMSCSTVRVVRDYDRETDFTNYTTYNYYPDMATGLNNLDERRLLRMLDLTMRGKGLMLSEEPDFLINIESTLRETPSNNSVGVGVGGSGRNVGGGVSVGIPVGQSKMIRHLRLDFVDSQKDLLFWQATAETSFHEQSGPLEREKKWQQVVTKMLSKYPPKTK